MTKRIVVLVLLLCCASFAADKILKETITVDGAARTYYIYAPPSEKPQPLLLLLHGSGRNGRIMIDNWKDLADKEGIILVAPDAKNSSAWLVPEDGPEFLHKVIDTVVSKASVDKRRIYIFGHSAGAEFALYMSILESRYFAATAIHAGAIRSVEFSIIDYATRKIPVAIWVGTNDDFFPLKVVRDTRDALTSRGIAAKLTEMPGHDHNYYAVSSKVNREAWDFLKTQTLSGDPEFTVYQ